MQGIVLDQDLPWSRIGRLAANTNASRPQIMKIIAADSHILTTASHPDCVGTRGQNLGGKGVDNSTIESISHCALLMATSQLSTVMCSALLITRPLVFCQDVDCLSQTIVLVQTKLVNPSTKPCKLQTQ